MSGDLDLSKFVVSAKVAHLLWKGKLKSWALLPRTFQGRKGTLEAMLADV
jgi:hypothetical protein